MAQALTVRKKGETLRCTRRNSGAGHGTKRRFCSSPIFNVQCPVSRASGFTLLELLLAIGLLAIVSTVTYMTFAVVTGGWKKGTAMADELHHGDFVMEQVVMGLRSAYYPDVKRPSGTYGFQHEDEGSGPYSSDVISWVKLGSALVGKDCPFVGSPHRVKFTVQDNDDGESAASVTAWQIFGQPEDFDPEDVPARFLSRKVTGFNCRAAYRKIDDEIDWKDEWEATNKLPTVVELTLFLEPLEKGEEPLEIKRILGIPVAPLSWR